MPQIVSDAHNSSPISRDNAKFILTSLKENSELMNEYIFAIIKNLDNDEDDDDSKRVVEVLCEFIRSSLPSIGMQARMDALVLAKLYCSKLSVSRYPDAYKNREDVIKIYDWALNRATHGDIVELMLNDIPI